MTDFSKQTFTVFHIRKTKKQKTRFIEHVLQFAEQNGLNARVEKGSFGVRNIVVGDPDRAKVIFTAHYDTCPVLPFPNFITPKNIVIYLLYQLLLVGVILAAVALVGTALGFGAGVFLGLLGQAENEALVSALISVLSLVSYLSIFLLLLAGPANRHTANDNTSGVITLLEILQALPEERREEVCVVFFDLEEMGLFGSSAFASKHKKAMKNKLLINFDCVSDGDRMLLVLRKGAKKYLPLLKESFTDSDAVRVEICEKGVFYPSDQMNFPCGVGVASLKYSKLLRTEYMNRIHTPRDMIFREENIHCLTQSSLALVELLV